jgi:glycosyltransferase involved in cell wall biosynthesis
MHILLTADTVGGVWTYARELAIGLVRRGMQVTLVSFGEIPEPRQTRWMEGLRNFDFRPTAFRLEWMQDSAPDIDASSEYLLNTIRETEPDLLHLNQYCYGAIDVDLPKIVVAHSDVVSWWHAVHGEDPPDSAWCRWYRETVTNGLRGATAVISPSNWMLQQIERHYLKPRHSIVIYNGLTPQQFNPHGEKENRVTSIGRLWDAAKQVSLLADCSLPWPVTIAGALNCPDHLGAELKKLPGGMTVELKGPLNCAQVRSLMASTSIYAATSRYEPFGLAPVEAALSRCAIVANDIPSLRELWGETACYFATNDPESLESTVRTLTSDRIQRRHMAELAYQRARRLFNAERMVGEYLDLYESLVPERAVAV